MLDYLAWFVLALVWLFGGAAVIDDGSDYKGALTGWCAVTAFIVGAVLVLALVFWAFLRLTNGSL